MTTRSAYSRVTFDALADARAIVVRGPARFTVLTSRLIRMEYDPDARFEDRPSQVFWFRRQPVPDFHVEEESGRLTLTTEHLRLEYAGGGAPFSAQTLAVTLPALDHTWRYGDVDAGNLRGTRRTLDEVDGAAPLEPGLLSRDGWVVVDDGRSLVFDDAGWLHPRDVEATDLYFFGYGRAYNDALRDYMAVSGPTPLLPRWVLGNWWSRYWAYSDAELRALMAEFRAHEVPLSVCIIDMDWHLVNVGEGVSGWTGYTWNNEYFPDPPDFLRWLRGEGLRTALNLHPALGIRPHESAYREMCARLGLDPEMGADIPFDIANPDFTGPYFEVLHHPQEAIGVDFWWMDWQQGTQTSVGGLDPLWWLNHLHFYDLARDGKRPFVFSRWGGLGNHRYPIGFSGDSVVSWASLAFQPYLTATAANVAYGWWSHDIGGHMKGVEDRELYTRWVQYGVFSPVFRLHSTKNPFHERRPWGYDAQVLAVTREAMQLRHALIPYLYTMSWLNERDGRVLARPMYHDYPEREEAYACPQQYFFGTALLAAPYTAPADPDTRLSRQVVWLPPGDWYHFFSGEYYAGDAWYALYGDLADIPVFARAGSVVPLGPRVGWGGVGNPEELHLHVFAGADGHFELYEDDGETLAYQTGAFALTHFELRQENGRLHVTVSPPEGDRTPLPDSRRYHIHVHGVAVPGEAALTLDGPAEPLPLIYDAARRTADFAPFTPGPSATARLTLAAPGEGELAARHDPTVARAERLIRAFRLDSTAKLRLWERLGELAETPGRLADFGLELCDSQARALLEVTQGAGVHYVTGAPDPHLLVLWNNHELGDVRHHFSRLRPGKWYAPDRYQSAYGVAPRFMALRPVGDEWRLRLDYFGLHTTVLDGPGVNK
ncbi:TIM-barrel domain-containing protein [Promineifilum sp.]|uniref:glycoside hydrolase family 31 protein n=1 Tax=Promineifilum sp. TaxID=2664178 RepID=UPI0035AEBA65